MVHTYFMDRFCFFLPIARYDRCGYMVFRLDCVMLWAITISSLNVFLFGIYSNVTINNADDESCVAPDFVLLILWRRSDALLRDQWSSRPTQYHRSVDCTGKGYSLQNFVGVYHYNFIMYLQYFERVTRSPLQFVI